MRGLVGLELEEAFFRYYPEIVWGITTDNMLPDWAPKRIRVCEEREPFYKGELAGIAEKGTGELMSNILKESCKKFTNVLLNSKINLAYLISFTLFKKSCLFIFFFLNFTWAFRFLKIDYILF